MLFDWTGDFDFKREKKKMGNEKLTKDNYFKGLVAGWRDEVGRSGCKGGFIKIQFLSALKLG